MEKLHGFVGVHGQIAYVPQQSWIQSMTIRENILFNKTYDANLYQQVVNACALEKDFEFLPDGGNFNEHFN
jgi:ATP-binding cassette subfamily C (CFTR/MRP) protein 1